MSDINEKLDLIVQARDDIQTALAKKGQVVGKDIRDYATAVSNIEGGGSEGIKQFDTIEHMQQDPLAEIGDLAVVYGSSIVGIDENSQFSSCTFPNTVVLDEAFTDFAYGQFQAVDTGSSYFDAMYDISSDYFTFEGNGDQMISIQYTSSDGITYTRTDGGTETVDFETVIQWENSGNPFNNILGEFMKISGNHFDGLYEYKNHLSDKLANVVTSITTVDSVPVLTQEAYDISTMLEAKQLLIEYSLNERHSFSDGLFVQRSDNVIDVYCTLESSGQYHNLLLMAVEGINNNQYLVNYEGSNDGRLYKFSINTSNDSVTKENISVAGSVSYTIDGRGPFTIKYTNEIIDDPFILLTEDAFELGNNVFYIDSSNVGHMTLLDFSYQPITDYILVPSQLNAIDVDVNSGKKFLGKNGVETGTLTNMTDLTVEELKTKINIWNTFNYGTFELNDKVGSISSVFTGRTDIITIPMIDTSHITRAAGMFMYCSNLTNIPQLDFSNVINMDNMFRDCVSLTSIPSMNTSNVTSVIAMCFGCTNLVDFPVLNLVNVTSPSNMVKDCSSLSNASLNNILQTCISMTNSSTKTLKYIGLTQAQATTCQSLSNYSDFISAGWTTGY